MSSIEERSPKVGRPSKNGLQDPVMLLRQMHAVWYFQSRRNCGAKFDAAVDETRVHLIERFGLKKASAALVKTIIAQTMPKGGEDQWAVEMWVDPVTGHECGALSFSPKKRLPRATLPNCEVPKNTKATSPVENNFSD